MPGCTNVPLADHSKAFLPGIKIHAQPIDHIGVFIKQVVPLADISTQVEQKLCIGMLDVFPLPVSDGFLPAKIIEVCSPVELTIQRRLFLSQVRNQVGAMPCAFGVKSLAEPRCHLPKSAVR